MTYIISILIYFLLLIIFCVLYFSNKQKAIFFTKFAKFVACKFLSNLLVSEISLYPFYVRDLRLSTKKIRVAPAIEISFDEIQIITNIYGSFKSLFKKSIVFIEIRNFQIRVPNIRFRDFLDPPKSSGIAGTNTENERRGPHAQDERSSTSAAPAPAVTSAGGGSLALSFSQRLSALFELKIIGMKFNFNIPTVKSEVWGGAELIHLSGSPELSSEGFQMFEMKVKRHHLRIHESGLEAFTLLPRSLPHSIFRFDYNNIASDRNVFKSNNGDSSPNHTISQISPRLTSNSAVGRNESLNIDGGGGGGTSSRSCTSTFTPMKNIWACFDSDNAEAQPTDRPTDHDLSDDPDCIRVDVSVHPLTKMMNVQMNMVERMIVN